MTSRNLLPGIYSVAQFTAIALMIWIPLGSLAFSARYLDAFCTRYLLLERDARTHDVTADDALWDVAAQLAAERRITLAGALDAANVGAAITRIAPFCVDLPLDDEADASARIEAFVAAVRAADARTLSAGPAAP